MDTLTIHYGIQGNGVSFRLTYEDYNKLKKLYPEAQPSKGVFVEYDMRSDFKLHRPQLERYVFPTLVGMFDEDMLKNFKHIEFIKTPEMQVTYIIEQTSPQYDSQIQSLSR